MMLSALLLMKLQLVIVGYFMGLFALLLMALTFISIKWQAKRPAKRFYGPKSEQVNNWLEALAKKGRKE